MANHKCAICGIEDDKTVWWVQYYHHASVYECIAALQKHNAELTTVINAYATILAAYRCGRRPPEECLNVINEYQRSMKQKGSGE